MVALTLQNCNKNILVVGPLYDKIDKLYNAISLYQNYDLIILNGNICFPHETAMERINIIDELSKSYNIIYNLGNLDLKLLNLTKSEQIRNWILNKPNVILIGFENQSSMIITNGGILPSMQKTDLFDNLETTFISLLDNVPWHLKYGGGYGYVISNNPLTNEAPKFYNYSAQMGNKYGPDMQVYAQEVNQYGLKNTILL